jgi:chromatin structure-remodeling complex subunit RSC1/2
MFHRDEHDRVLFFTAPPLDIPTIPSSTKLRGHNIKYLAKKARDETELAEKRKLREEENINKAVVSQKRKLEEDEARAENIKRLKEDALAILTKQMDSGTEVIYKRMYGDDGKKVMQAEDERLAVVQQEVEAQREREAKLDRENEARNVIPLKRNVL